MTRPNRSVFRAFVVLAVTAMVVTSCSSEPEAEEVQEFVSDGVLTIATGELAAYPWFVGDHPENARGFEAALAYAIADKLGFSTEDVVWLRTSDGDSEEGGEVETRAQSDPFAPGQKMFDLSIQQHVISEDFRELVDFSVPYYEVPQVLLTHAASDAVSATSVADFEHLIVGAATGTASFDVVDQTIQTFAGINSFGSHADAVRGLESSWYDKTVREMPSIPVDVIGLGLPVALEAMDNVLSDPVLLGQLRPVEGVASEQLGLVLVKDSVLTERVNQAIEELRTDGTLDELITQWLGRYKELPILD